TVAVSTTVASRLRRWGVPGSRIKVIPNGIDAARLRFDPVLRTGGSLRFASGTEEPALRAGGPRCARAGRRRCASRRPRAARAAGRRGSAALHPRQPPARGAGGGRPPAGEWVAGVGPAARAGLATGGRGCGAAGRVTGGHGVRGWGGLAGSRCMGMHQCVESGKTHHPRRRRGTVRARHVGEPENPRSRGGAA
ncbi:glycosyltransferase, partial [Streptomyces chitinivorans]